MSFSGVLQELALPPLSLPSVHTVEPSENDHLQQWKIKASRVLIDIKALLAHNDVNDLTDSEVASIVAKTTPFDEDNPWSSESMHNVAKDIMTMLPEPTLEVVTCVLSEHIKPRFSNTPHPHLNPSSGRRLPRTAGGPSAAQDFYEDQVWKSQPGSANLLLWCIERLKTEDYESVWHLVIPPTMTLLDDYETTFKLQGVEAVSALLHHVPPALLRRTGVDGLLVSSLRATTTALHTPLTPKLLRKSIPAFLRLIDCTIPPNSKARFDQICTLLGDSILGGIWVYASDDLATIEASMAVLPEVLRDLGLGSVRYLKMLIPQMVHNLSQPPLQKGSVSLQIASLHALEVTIEVCQPRIGKWKGHIVEGLARCWVSLAETSSNDQSSTELRSALRRVSLSLTRACPSVANDEYKRLLACDEHMFRELASIETAVR